MLYGDRSLFGLDDNCWGGHVGSEFKGFNVVYLVSFININNAEFDIK